METGIPIQEDQSPPIPKHIFILSGQSNMSGRGGVDTKHHRWNGVVPPDCQPHPSIVRLSAKLNWEPAREPLHFDIDSRKVCGVGPGMSFANATREKLAAAGSGGECVAMGLVPCAVGGTAIKQWARGQHLYENMVKRAKESVKKSKGGEIKALVWFQGESDTSSFDDAVAYKGNMERLIHNVREDLGLPSLPVIQVAIASGDGKYIEKVREAQLGMNLANVVCVDAKGLPLKQDHLHLTTQAQVSLGHMLADAYLTHISSSSQTPNHVIPCFIPNSMKGKSKSKSKTQKHQTPTALHYYFVVPFASFMFLIICLSIKHWISKINYETEIKFY